MFSWFKRWGTLIIKSHVFHVRLKDLEKNFGYKNINLFQQRLDEVFTLAGLMGYNIGVVKDSHLEKVFFNFNNGNLDFELRFHCWNGSLQEVELMIPENEYNNIPSWKKDPLKNLLDII